MGCGIGMAQGYATLGRIGFEDRMDYTAIGVVINLAARLCAQATHGQVLTSGIGCRSRWACQIRTPWRAAVTRHEPSDSGDQPDRESDELSRRLSWLRSMRYPSQDAARLLVFNAMLGINTMSLGAVT
jgi:hypothetical protein